LEIVFWGADIGKHEVSATLFGLGIINWYARKAQGYGLIGMLLGNLFVQVLSLVVVLRTMTLGAGAAVTPGIVIHVVLGGFFLFFLLKAKNVRSRGVAA
jgi:hypothetical protein